MEFFGDYLVRKKVITKAQLIRALIQQGKDLPSFSQYLSESRSLTEDQLLAAFRYQSHRPIEFLQACRELNFITPVVENSLMEWLRKTRVPVGQILVRAGVEIRSVVKALTEFYDEKNKGNFLQSMVFGKLEGRNLEEARVHLQTDVLTELIQLYRDESEPKIRPATLEILSALKGSCLFFGLQLGFELLKQAELSIAQPMGVSSRERIQTLLKLCERCLTSIKRDGIEETFFRDNRKEITELFTPSDDL